MKYVCLYFISHSNIASPSTEHSDTCNNKLNPIGHISDFQFYKNCGFPYILYFVVRKVYLDKIEHALFPTLIV